MSGKDEQITYITQEEINHLLEMAAREESDQPGEDEVNAQENTQYINGDNYKFYDLNSPDFVSENIMNRINDFILILTDKLSYYFSALIDAEIQLKSANMETLKLNEYIRIMCNSCAFIKISFTNNDYIGFHPGIKLLRQLIKHILGIKSSGNYSNEDDKLDLFEKEIIIKLFSHVCNSIFIKPGNKPINYELIDNPLVMSNNSRNETLLLFSFNFKIQYAVSHEPFESLFNIILPRSFIYKNFDAHGNETGEEPGKQEYKSNLYEAVQDLWLEKDIDFTIYSKGLELLNKQLNNGKLSINKNIIGFMKYYYNFN